MTIRYRANGQRSPTPGNRIPAASFEPEQTSRGMAMNRQRQIRSKAITSTAWLKAIGTAATLLTLALAPNEALGDNCRDRVQELAAHYKVATDSPTIPPGEARKPLSSGELARSGGVIEPPPTSNRSVIAPPRDARSNMPTMPDVTPSAPRGNGAEPKSLEAADMSTLQALLVVARAQAERGMETECLEGLRKAQQLIERQRQ